MPASMLERRRNLQRPAETSLRLARQAADDGRAQRLSRPGTSISGRGGSSLSRRAAETRGVSAGEGQLPGHHLVEHDAQGVDVRGSRHRAASHLLRGHVLRRPENGRAAGQWPVLRLLLAVGLDGPGDAEVGDDDPRGARSARPCRRRPRDQQHVAALEVAVDDPLGVGRREALAHLPDQRAAPRRVVSAPGGRCVGERLALEELHGEEVDGDSAGRRRVVQLVDAADVRMAHPAGEQHLAAEALHGRRVGRRCDRG